MALSFKHNSSVTKLIIIGEFVLVSYLLYTLTVSVYKSYQIDQHILNFKKENDEIAEQNRQKEADYSYYTSDAYIEKIAKQNLGLRNPGEEILVIGNDEMSGDVSDDAQNALEDNVTVKPLSNPQRWWKFFFHSL